DRVAAGEGNGILDGRIACADYDDRLPAQRVGRLECVLHARQIAPGHSDPAWMTLHSEGQDDMFAPDAVARLGGDLEVTERAADAGDFAMVLYVDLRA